MQRIIAIDYDQTYTDFKEICNYIIENSEKYSYKVIICTFRYQEEINDELKNLEKEIEVYYTGRIAKQDFLSRKDIYPDLWIDDNPLYIFKNGY